MVGEEVYGIVHIILLKVVMTEKEKQIQDALGLLKTYCGYVKVVNRGDASFHRYDIYEVQDVTKADACAQLDCIMAVLHKKSKELLTLQFVVDKAENPYAGGRRCSNPKS